MLATSARVRAKMSVCAPGVASSRLTIAAMRSSRCHDVNDVIDVRVRRAERGPLDVRRVVLDAVRERAHVARERRRDEVRAVPRRGVLEDRLELLAKAEVEHAVGLVEDDRADLGRVDAAALEVIEQAPGSPDDDGRTGGEARGARRGRSRRRWRRRRARCSAA